MERGVHGARTNGEQKAVRGHAIVARLFGRLDGSLRRLTRPSHRLRHFEGFHTHARARQPGHGADRPKRFVCLRPLATAKGESSVVVLQYQYAPALALSLSLKSTSTPLMHRHCCNADRQQRAAACFLSVRADDRPRTHACCKGRRRERRSSWTAACRERNRSEEGLAATGPKLACKC